MQRESSPDHVSPNLELAPPVDLASPDDWQHDHRAIATRLDLCHFEDTAPGMVFWHPRGWALVRRLEAAVRAHVEAGGYHEVRSPQLVRRAVWERSGHWDAFRDSMFVSGDADDPSALKPVSCPGHIAIVKRSYPALCARDLPIRLAEFGLVHRAEASGALQGLLRLRQFTQDDGHIFCTDDQIEAEIAAFCRDLPAFYRKLGFDELTFALSLRPDNRLGDDAWWDRAESMLAAAVERLGWACELQPGAGAIYGPKLELSLRDRRGRAWQCGTIQLDFVMPQRFDVRYTGDAGESRHVVMLHRALFGSIERFLGILLEHHGGSLPAWLAPDQIAVLPVGPAHADRAREVRQALAAAGMRARLDDDATLSRRILRAHQDGIPFAIVIGDRELTDGSLAIRSGERRWSAPVADALAELQRACTMP
ncbi:MAG TPA: threonine--tRNA ligase [Kofleriaceae bacterium]|nr:threonine--tRNA ligase [Kofleriaceae bacterium]